MDLLNPPSLSGVRDERRAVGRSEDTVAGDVLSAATKRSYAFCEGRFRKFIEGRYEGELPFLSRVRKKDLVAYKNSTIQEGGIKNETRQTARLHFSGAKSFLAFCRMR